MRLLLVSSRAQRRSTKFYLIRIGICCFRRVKDVRHSIAGVKEWQIPGQGGLQRLHIRAIVNAADLVVVGIGVIANSELADACAIVTANGIVVDALLRSSDENVYAIGDCCSFPNTWDGTAIRVESVQNATDQARALAKTLTGTPTPYSATPWFWSQQGAARLQIAGITRSDDEAVFRGDPADGRFSIYCFRGELLAGVESVNSPADHLGARRLLDSRIPVTRGQVADLSFDLKAHSKGGVAA